MPSEHQFERPDARSAKESPLPDWGGDLLARAALAGLLASIVVFFLVFFLPSFISGDLGVLIGWGWISTPAGFVFGPLAGWFVKRVLQQAVESELASYSPRREDVAFWIHAVLTIDLLIGAALWIAVSMMPNHGG